MKFNVESYGQLNRGTVASSSFALTTTHCDLSPLQLVLGGHFSGTVHLCAAIILIDARR